jgi:hypothetical protein
MCIVFKNEGHEVEVPTPEPDRGMSGAWLVSTVPNHRKRDPSLTSYRCFRGFAFSIFAGGVIRILKCDMVRREDEHAYHASALAPADDVLNLWCLDVLHLEALTGSCKSRFLERSLTVGVYRASI